MAETLKLRNELVHEWMLKRTMLQSTSENRLAMIDKLRGAIGKLGNAERAIREGTRTMMAKVGVPEGFVEGEHQRLRNSQSVARRIPLLRTTSRRSGTDRNRRATASETAATPF